MIERRILTQLLEVDDLPTLPEIMNKVLETVADRNSSAQDVTELLERDHAISVRILRLANSAFYGLRHPADSIRRAVVVVGFDAIQQLALATSVFDALANREQFALDPEDFWMHSLGTAKAAQILCAGPCAVESAEGCFTAGLLHDIGKYLLALVLGKEYQAVVEDTAASGRPLREAELELLGTTHGEVGKWIAKRWNLPDLLVDVIGNVHRPATYSGPNTTEVAVVAMADGLSRVAKFGFAGDPAASHLDPRLLDILGVTRSVLEQAAEELQQYRDETRKFLDLLTE